MAFMAAAAPYIGAAMSVAGAVTQMGQAREASEYNVALAEMEQRQAVRASVEDERQLRERYARQIGKARAGFGASGVRVNEGSPLLAVQKTYENMLLDVENLREGARLAVLAGETRKSAYRSQARSSMFRTVFQTGSSLLTSDIWGSMGGKASVTTGRNVVGRGPMTSPLAGARAARQGWFTV